MLYSCILVLFLGYRGPGGLLPSSPCDMMNNCSATRYVESKNQTVANCIRSFLALYQFGFGRWFDHPVSNHIGPHGSGRPSSLSALGPDLGRVYTVLVGPPQFFYWKKWWTLLFVVISTHFSHASVTNFRMTIFTIAWWWGLQCGGTSCAPYRRKKSTEFGEITQTTWPLCHSRSSILVPIESPRATFY